MPTRITQAFPSYSLFGKAFPGIVFILSVVTLLPTDPLLSDPSKTPYLDPSATTVAIVVLLLTILGFSIGQALHSFAVKFEKVSCWVARRFYIIVFGVKSFLISYVINVDSSVQSENIADFEKWVTENQRLITVFAIIGGVILAMFLAVITSEWFVYSLGIVLFAIMAYPRNRIRRYWIPVFYPHRRVFRLVLDGYNMGFPGDRLKNRYKDAVSESLAEDLDYGSTDDQNYLYIRTMSELEYAGDGRAKKFQSILSFCRTSWMVLLVMCIIYYLFWNFELYGEYHPLLTIFGVKPNAFLWISIIMGIGVVVLLEGVRQGKRHFIEYMMADYITLTS